MVKLKPKCHSILSLYYVANDVYFILGQLFKVCDFLVAFCMKIHAYLKRFSVVRLKNTKSF